MFGDEDLALVFYADSIVQLTLVGAEPAQSFPAYMGEEDQELLQGYAVGTVRLIHYPTAGATLAEGAQVSDGTATWRVLREPRLINDGAESQAYLVPAA